MICHQKKIREKMAKTPLPDEAERRVAAASFVNADVRPITKAEAKSVILDYEWLGNMGTTQFCFGLFFGVFLAGVACFGSTAGSSVPQSVCGKEYAAQVITLTRGACVHWAHPHSASFLISRACDEMVKEGYNIFVAYSDGDAGEIGTVYQASGWLYVGKGGVPSTYIHPDGGRKDSSCIRAMTRSRVGRPDRGKSPTEMRFWVELMAAFGQPVQRGVTPYILRMSREEARELMAAEGWMLKRGTAKHRYIHFAGDKRTVRALRKALRLKVLTYPKRDAAQFEVSAAGTTSGGEVQLLGAAPKI